MNHNCVNERNQLREENKREIKMGLMTLLSRHNQEKNGETKLEIDNLANSGQIVEKEKLTEFETRTTLCGKRSTCLSSPQSNDNDKNNSLKRHKSIAEYFKSETFTQKINEHQNINVSKQTSEKTTKSEHIVPSQTMVSPIKPTTTKRQSYQPDIQITKIKEQLWMCDVCKSSFFNNFSDACLHEVSCKLGERQRHASGFCKPFKMPSSPQKLPKKEHDSFPIVHKTNTMTKTAETCWNNKPAIENIITEKKISEEKVPDIAISGTKKTQDDNCVLDIGIVPKNRYILSDYNYTLTENIEFFEIKTKSSCSEYQHFDISGIPTRRLGLRCKHCSTSSRHMTAASFFPSTTNSIASGLGTIGARHFAGGKCPKILNEIIERMRITKKSSQQQTRMQGKIGLDAYCRELVKRENITNHGFGGIYVDNSSKGMKRYNIDSNTKCQSKICESRYGTNDPLSFGPTKNIKTTDVVYNPDPEARGIEKKEINMYEKDPSTSFVLSTQELFWECRWCNSLPYSWRAQGSTIFCSSTPSAEAIKKHLRKCQGRTPLRIPRSATTVRSYGEKDLKVKVKWKTRHNALKSEMKYRTQNSTSIIDEMIKSKQKSARRVKEGIEDEIMAKVEDIQLTTEFAHYTVSQLKKCHLTRAGGSRGACPIGYPGLACLHCAGSTPERRFFYTSADHLRNSFSHIPAHLAICRQCPDEVKEKLDALKLLRNKQKSQLKAGSHKLFIDTVWERLHGPSGGIIADLEPHENRVCDENSISSMSVDTEDYFQSDFETLIIDPIQSILAFPSDRNQTTDYIYYSILQLAPRTNTDCTAPGLICKHCVISSENKTDVHDFNFHSADDLSKDISKISEHMFNCSSCPESVKENLRIFKSMRATQESMVSFSEQRKFVGNVWKRLLSSLMKDAKDSNATIQTKSKDKRKHRDLSQPICDVSHFLENKMPLVTEKDMSLVSDFTFYTMQQMTSCSLEASGNGARSTFDYGFPGLACVHCSLYPNGRKFFYRTAEILSGNYAHIPNHLMSCKHCPASIKAHLIEKKKIHAAQKSKLSRGSQRIFFTRLWSRLHKSKNDLEA